MEIVLELQLVGFEKMVAWDCLLVKKGVCPEPHADDV